jgi:DNA-binding transcriptional LysR family regulator
MSEGAGSDRGGSPGEPFLGRAGFSLDRLATLCRVAEQGGIMAAARHGLDAGSASDRQIIANRQAQYSRQIAELEEFFGGAEKLVLMDRSRKPHRLNERGQRLAVLGRAFFAGLEDFVAEEHSGKTRLVIGAGERLIQWLLMPTMLPPLRRRFPGASILFLNRQTQEIVRGLQEGTLDLGLLRRSAVEGSGLRTNGRWKEDYLFFIPCRMRPKPPSPPRVADLAGYPLAVLEGAGESRSALLRLFTSAGVRPNIQLECSSLTQVAQAVESKEYAAFLPRLAESRFSSKEVEAHRVAGLEELDAELTLAWNPERAKFRPVIRETARLLGTL